MKQTSSRNAPSAYWPGFAFVSMALAIVISGCQHHPGTTAEAPALEIGAAETDITPPVGGRMAGYFDERLATGVHDPLKAKALVFRQGTQQVSLVCCDLVGVPLKLTSQARAVASQRTGIPVSHIVVSATHSHTGPLFMDVRRDYLHKSAIAKNGSDPAEPIDYPGLLSARIVEAIVAAQSNLKPATLSAGIGKLDGITFNRRFWMKNGKVVFNPGLLNPDIVRPAGPSDSDVGILLARTGNDGQPFAGLTVFAMHSDTVGGTEYSADFEYFLEQTLRQRFGTGFVSAFAAGTCGDLNHINVSKKEATRGFEVPERIGRMLGNTVLDTAAKARSLRRPALAVRSTTVQVPLQRFTPEQLADAQSKIDKIADPKTEFATKVTVVKVLDLAARGETCPMEVQAIQLDSDTALVCLPGELFVELGLAIKQASPFKNTLVLTICNDRPSYVPTRKAFSEGSYEITNARVQPGVGETLVDTALQLLKSLKASSEAR